MLSTNDESIFFAIEMVTGMVFFRAWAVAFQRPEAALVFFQKKVGKVFQKIRKLFQDNDLQIQKTLLSWLESKGKKRLFGSRPQRKKSITKKKVGNTMSKNEKNSAPKTKKANPELEAPQVETIALEVPKTIPSPKPEKGKPEAAEKDFRAEFVEKAQAARQAAKGFSFGTGGGGLRFKGQMSGLDAALRILAESEKPLNAGAITKVAIEQGLWAPEGQTPASTMSALLQAEVVDLSVGESGAGTLELTNGRMATSTRNVYIGDKTGSIGTVFDETGRYSNRRACTGCSLAARMAGRTPEITAIRSEPATTLTTIAGSRSVGICENM